jgi:hypothetical protein
MRGRDGILFIAVTELAEVSAIKRYRRKPDL